MSTLLASVPLRPNSLEFNEILWVGLGIVEYDAYAWVGGIVNHTVIQPIGIVGVLGGSDHSMCSLCELTHQDLTQVDVFYSSCIWFRVLVPHGVVGIDSKIGSIPESSGCIQITNTGQP